MFQLIVQAAMSLPRFRNMYDISGVGRIVSPLQKEIEMLTQWFAPDPVDGENEAYKEAKLYLDRGIPDMDAMTDDELAQHFAKKKKYEKVLADFDNAKAANISKMVQQFFDFLGAHIRLANSNEELVKEIKLLSEAIRFSPQGAGFEISKREFQGVAETQTPDAKRQKTDSKD